MTRSATPMPSLLEPEQPAKPGAAAPAQQGRAASEAAQARKEKLKVVLAVLALLASGVILYVQFFSGPVSAAEASRRRDLIDADSGELFRDFAIPDDGAFPYVNPKTGKPTLFPAEKCFWTKDGRAKLDPTLVFVKAYLGPDDPRSREPSVCPDCGRPVVQHNPLPPIQLMSEAAERQKP